MEKVRPYFAFKGRANRLPYWMTSLVAYAALLVAALFSVWLGFIGGVLMLAVLVGSMWAGLAVAIRRLHDRGKSGWWLLLMLGPNVLLSGLGGVASLSDPDVGAFFSLLSLPFAIWMFVELGCLTGTAGPNRFGDDPLWPAQLEVFS